MLFQPAICNKGPLIKDVCKYFGNLDPSLPEDKFWVGKDAQLPVVVGYKLKTFVPAPAQALPLSSVAAVTSSLSATAAS